MMNEIKRKRELKEQGIGEGEDMPVSAEDAEEFQLDKRHDVFNKSLEEETKTINGIAQDLLRKVKY